MTGLGHIYGMRVVVGASVIDPRLTDGMCEHHIQRALWIRHRGGASCILPNYTPIGWQECDLFVVLKSGFSIEYEIKLSRADFKADFRKRGKHSRLANRSSCRLPTRFFYAMPEGLVSVEDIPDYAGLVYLRWSSPLPSRQTTPIVTVVRPAPRLSAERGLKNTVRDMRQTAYWRFWSERFAFEDYRRNVALIRQHCPDGEGGG